MSKWYDQTKEDMSMSDDGKELHIFFDSDYSGAIYVSVDVDDVKDVIKEARKKRKNRPSSLTPRSKI